MKVGYEECRSKGILAEEFWIRIDPAERPSSGSRTSMDRSENIPVIHLLAVEDDIEILTNHSMERLFEA